MARLINNATRTTFKVHESKNRKKGWRKHSKIDEIEEYLEEERQDERIGDSFGKSNANLFFLQVDPNEKRGVLKSKGRKRLNEPLRCFQILSERSSVPAPIKPYQLQTKSLKVKTIRKSKRNIPVFKKTVHKTSAQEPVNFDLWDEKRYEIDDLTKLGTEIISNRFAKVPSHLYQKPSLLPAVEPPHPGASYNPSFADHQALLAAAVEIEEAKVKQEMHIDRVLSQKFPTSETAPTQESWIAEMSHGLFESDDENVESEEDEEEVVKTWGKPIDRENRKLHTKRNTENFEKRKMSAITNDKIKKRLNHDFNRIKQFKKEIDAKTEEFKVRAEKRDQEREAALYKPRRIGREKYREPEIAVNLTEELAGCLRNIKAEGNVMVDRYNSLQRRNVIETRSKKKFIRKYKLKKQVKRSHREAQKEIDDARIMPKRSRKRNRK